MIVDQGLLDKVWSKWLTSKGSSPRTLYLSRTYTNISRNIPIAKQFEDWLWQEGAMIKRENKKCYLQFFNDDDATMFVLRNS